MTPAGGPVLRTARRSTTTTEPGQSMTCPGILSSEDVVSCRGRAVRFALGIALAASGCTESRSVVSATPTPVPVVSTHVRGVVQDSAYRLLTGVKVELADGPQAGASAMTTAGIFEIPGTSTGAVTLRATKDGFATTTLSVSWRPAGDGSLVTIILEPLGTSLQIEPGNYTISVTTDRATSHDGAAACSGLPDAFLTRRYAATITPQSASHRSVFSVTLQLNNPPPFSTSVGFGLGVAGDFAGFTIDGPEIGEILPDFTYLAITGSAPTDAPATATGSSILIPFSGSFEYCVLKSPMGLQNNCFTTPAEQKIAYAQCLSTHDVMVLTKR